MLVYSDPDHPENLTAYLPNKKTNDVLVHAEAGWEVQPASLVLPPMAQKSVDTLFDHQPYEDADDYGPLMKELAENEKRYAAGSELRPILVRNKDLLARALETLPVADGRAIGATTSDA
jgi:23S rRNA A2030 N6-methylase RlmJ